jgi:predicted transcriptional regulator
MPERSLLLARNYLAKELTSYQDPLFQFLFHDTAKFASQTMDLSARSGKRVSIYGIRGIGKTTCMQGVVSLCLQEKAIDKMVPVNVVVEGAINSSDAAQLSQQFHKAILISIGRLANSKSQVDRILNGAKKYAPAITKKVTQAVSLVYPAVSLGSDLAAKGIKKILGSSDVDSFETLLSKPNLQADRISNLLMDRIEKDSNLFFSIDELDKTRDDIILSDFFDGSQAWFQGRKAVISLSYTFGESLKDTRVTSASRISKIVPFPGVTSLNDAREIISKRVILGLLHEEEDENKATKTAERIFPDETVNALLNVSAPNAHILLERTLEALDLAIQKGSNMVHPDMVYQEPTETEEPSEIETLVLQTLLKSGRLSNKGLVERLDKDKGQVSKIIKKMLSNGWVSPIGPSRRAEYYVTPKGEAAVRKKGRSAS